MFWHTIIKLIVTLCIFISSAQAELIGKAWDKSVSNELKSGCIDLTEKDDKEPELKFLTILLGMASKVFVKQANVSEEEINNNEKMENLILKIAVKGCRGGLFMENDSKYNQFNFTEKVRASMEIYVRDILNKK